MANISYLTIGNDEYELYDENSRKKSESLKYDIENKQGIYEEKNFAGQQYNVPSQSTYKRMATFSVTNMTGEQISNYLNNLGQLDYNYFYMFFMFPNSQ